MGGVGVPQIVKPDAGQGSVGELAKPILCQRIGLQRCAIGLRHNERGFRQPHADL